MPSSLDCREKYSYGKVHVRSHTRTHALSNAHTLPHKKEEAIIPTLINKATRRVDNKPSIWASSLEYKCFWRSIAALGYI
jgi:hypothetical protein